MTIAMLACWLDGWYQTQLWRGAVAACRVHGCRFLCLVGYSRPSSPIPTGPEGIGGLAARPEIDGTLLSAGPLTFWEGGAAMEAILSWLPPGKPAICLGQEWPDLPSIVPDGGGIGGMVHHLVGEHGCRNLAFLGGPETNADSVRRLSDFVLACDQTGIGSDPRLREVGHFYLEGGEAAMERILDRRIPFDAVVCANDAMAMGAALVLERRGIRIPEDVRLVGYDDCEESRTHQPPLTTVRSPTYQIGFRGVERCLEEFEGKPGLAAVETHSTIQVVRKSCGCLAKASPQHSLPETAVLRGMPTVSGIAELMATEHPAEKDRFIRDFRAILRDSREGELEEWQEILFSASRLALRESREKGRHIEETILQAHVLLSEAREGTQSIHRRNTDALVRQLHITVNALNSDLSLEGYPSRLAEALKPWCGETRLFLFNADLAPTSGQDLSKCDFAVRLSLRDGLAAFLPPTEGPLPPWSGNGEIWIGLPVEHAGHNFGVLLFHEWFHSESFIEHLRLVVSSFVYGLWRCEVDRLHMEELHALSVRDSLTGLYNRRGLVEIGERMVARATREGRCIGVLMADLDGLKAINDAFGHGEGDRAIIALAEALRDSLRASDTVARLGGDEFVALFPLGEWQPATKLPERIRKALERRNRELSRPWSVCASLGIRVWDPSDGRILPAVLSEADVDLYQDKKRRRHSLDSFERPL